MAPKYLQLADMLRIEARKIAENGGNRLPTEMEISSIYSVSRQTVRNALSLLERDGTISRRQGSGSYINKRQKENGTRQIAVITTFIDDYIFPSILHDAQSIFAENGFSTLVYATGNNVFREREILKELLSRDISGILIEGSRTALPTPNEELFDEIRKQKIPILFLHGLCSLHESFPYIMDDNEAGGKQLAKHLIAKGHRKIGGIFKSDDIQGPMRYYGMISAMLDAGLNVEDRRICWYDTLDRTDIIGDTSYDRLDRFIKERLTDSTAVICYNDEIAYNLVKRLLDMGKKIPEDVAVVSFDNSFYSHIGPVPITSIGHRMKAGKATADMLLSVLREEEPDSVRMPWELHQRASS